MLHIFMYDVTNEYEYDFALLFFVSSIKNNVSFFIFGVSNRQVLIYRLVIFFKQIPYLSIIPSLYFSR